jgi:fumarate hydratase class II
LTMITALDRLAEELDRKSREWDELVKIGRTHLMDATPIRVGQVFSGCAAQARLSKVRAEWALKRVQENGGTAVGTGINTHPEFARRVYKILSHQLGNKFCEAANHPESQAAKDTFVEAHGSGKR